MKALRHVACAHMSNATFVDSYGAAELIGGLVYCAVMIVLVICVVLLKCVCEKCAECVHERENERRYLTNSRAAHAERRREASAGGGLGDVPMGRDDVLPPSAAAGYCRGVRGAVKPFG